ncbi:MAG: DUF1269 domain-containing protein [Syntrophobacteraceae bacterium]
MSNLVIGIFKDESQAEEARRRLLAKETGQALGIEDAVVMKKTSEGKVKFRHLTRETVRGAIMGAFWGAMLGLLLLNPVFLLGGLVIGFFIGLVSGALSHIGVDADFARSEAATMNAGDSAVFVLAKDNAEKVLEEIEKFNGNVVQTRLCTQLGDIRECSIHRGEAHPVGAAG